ncbi:MAG TPA: GNAT family N-acetyltransferase [Anaerolineales bacterium]
MDHTPAFPIDLPGYTLRWLKLDDAVILQRLFDRCPDYAEIVEGEEVSPTAAEELFQSLPSGGMFSNKLVTGIFQREGEIGGVLEGMRHYPEENIWWIGLLLLASDIRNHGVGRKIVEAFVDYARGNQVKAVMLGVVEDNRRAFQFWSKNGFVLVRKTEPRPFGKKNQPVFVMRRKIE